MVVARSNCSRTAVESKSNPSCNQRLICVRRATRQLISLPLEQVDQAMSHCRRRRQQTNDDLRWPNRLYISASDLRHNSSGHRPSSRSSTSGRESTSGSILKKRQDDGKRLERNGSCSSSSTIVSPIPVSKYVNLLQPSTCDTAYRLYLQQILLYSFISHKCSWKKTR